MAAETKPNHSEAMGELRKLGTIGSLGLLLSSSLIFGSSQTAPGCSPTTGLFLAVRA